MLKRFEVYGSNTIMDFGEFGVNKETAKEVGKLLLQLTNSPEDMGEVDVTKLTRVRR